jgi:hypothetical protein
MRSLKYVEPVRFNWPIHGTQPAKRSLIVAVIGAAIIQFDLSPVLHGAAAHLEEAPSRAVFERMPTFEFTGSLGDAGAGRTSPARDPEVKHRVGYVEFED